MSEPRKSSLKSRLVRIFSWITGISIGSAVFILIAAIIALAIFVKTDVFQHALRDRILQVAKSELGASITFENASVSLFRLEPKIDFINVKVSHAATKTVADIKRITIGMSLLVSAPLLLIRELNLSSIEVEGLSYKLESIKVVQEWLDQLRPKYSYIPPTFQTSVGRLGFRNVEVEIALPEAAFYSRGLQGLVRLESVDLQLKTSETKFDGQFTIANLTSGNMTPLDGTFSVESGSFNSSRLQFRRLELKSQDDVFDISGGLKRWENPILDLKGTVSAKLEHYLSQWNLKGDLSTDFTLIGPWNKLEGRGYANIEQLRFRKKNWDKVQAQWALAYPQLELKSLTWESGSEKGKMTGFVPLTPNEAASFDIKLENVELGPNLGIVAPDLIKWRGQTSGSIQYRGMLYPEMRGAFDWKFHISNYQIRSPLHETYSFGLPELDLAGHGNLEGIQNGDFTATLAVGESKWGGGGRWTPKDFLLDWDAVFPGGDFGELLSRKLKIAGSLKGNLSGPFNHLVMKVEPKFSEFSLNGKTITNLKGHLVLENRILAGAPIVSDQVSIMGGIYFRDEGPEEYSNVKLNTKDLDLKFLMDILGVHEGWGSSLGGKITMAGFLKGPISRPIGSGSIALKDWTLRADQTRGRMAQAKWATAGNDIYLDTVELRFSPEGEMLIGEMSFDKNGLVDFSLEGSRIRTNDIFYIFEYDTSLQGLADLSVDYQRNSPSLKARIKLTKTMMAGVAEADSNIRLAWVGNQMEFDCQLFGDTISIIGTSHQNAGSRETAASFKIEQFNSATLFRALAYSRLEIPVEGTGVLNFTQKRRSDENLLPGLFVEPGDFKGEIKVQRANLSRGSAVLQSIDPFTLKLGGTNRKSPRWEFPSLTIRSAEKIFSMKGFYESTENFSLDMSGTIDMRAIAGLYAPFSRSEGFASVNGKWDHRGFVGRFQIMDGLITFQNSPLVVRNVSAKILSAGSHLELSELKGDFREGSLSASGHMDFGNQEIRAAQFSVLLQNTLLQPQQGVSFRASGPLNLKIAGSEGELSGKLLIREAYYRRRLDVKADLLKLLNSDRGSYRSAEEEQAFWKKWKLNVQLITEDPVNVRNNLAEGSANINLNILGLIKEPRLKGSIRVVRGDFYYHNRQFTISSGSVQFADQISNIPSFDIRADTEVGDYRISVQILGDANDQKIKYSSDPPLGEKDILTLVSFGYRSSDTEVKEQDPARSASFTGISFVTGQLQDKIEGGLSTGLGIRRFQLVPSYSDQTRKTELQMTVGTDLVRNKLEVNYSSFLSAVGGQKVELEYKFNRSVSLIGSWRNIGSLSTTADESDDFGGDLRFRFEFE
jgi:hypothetical protein